MAAKMNIDSSKSYATEGNLTKALYACGISHMDYLVVCNRDGRYTAIFPTGWNQNNDSVRPAHLGFMVVG